MTRPARNRLLLLALCAVCIALGSVAGVPLFITLLVAAAVSYITARDVFAARRAIRQRRWVDALMSLQKFEAKPPPRPLCWLTMSTYSFEPVAIARNLSGIVHLENNNLDLAQAAFQSALAKDPLYAVPQLNLAVVAARRKDTAAMERHLAEAKRLGLSGKKAHARVRALL
jgi:hypothetical protein